jgi:hypothetical protein
MKKLLYILLIAPIFVFGQGWEQSYYGGRSLSEVLQTTDGGYIAIGSNHEFNTFLIRTNTQGDTLWTKSISLSDTTDTDAFCLTLTNDGDYVISGSISSVGLLMKLDDDGNQQWLQTYDERILGHLNASDGGYVIITYGGIMKTDSYGNKLWGNLLETSLNLSDVGFAYTTDGGVVIVGSTPWPEYDPILIKTDVFGNEEWSIILSTENFEGGYVQQTSDGGFVISGCLGNSVEYTTHIVKTDEYGNQQWSKSYISGGQLGEVQQTTDGGYVSCGSFVSIFGDTEGIVLIKTDFNGTLQWYQTFEDSDTAKRMGHRVKQTTDGGYILGGSIGEPYPNDAFYLLKTNSEGVLTTNELIECNPNKTLLKTIDLLGRDAVDKPFTPLIDIYDDGSSQKRIIIE